MQGFHDPNMIYQKELEARRKLYRPPARPVAPKDKVWEYKSDPAELLAVGRVWTSMSKDDRRKWIDSVNAREDIDAKLKNKHFRFLMTQEEEREIGIILGNLVWPRA